MGDYASSMSADYSAGLILFTSVMRLLLFSYSDCYDVLLLLLSYFSIVFLETDTTD